MRKQIFVFETRSVNRESKIQFAHTLSGYLL
jgi:hypothetical protein